MLQADHSCAASHRQLRQSPLKPEDFMEDLVDMTYQITADELSQFIERIERLDAEKKIFLINKRKF